MARWIARTCFPFHLRINSTLGHREQEADVTRKSRRRRHGTLHHASFNSSQITASSAPYSLTNRKFSNKLHTMKAVSDLLEPIERRLGDLIARLDSVRRDNTALRNQVQQLEVDKKALQEKIDTAATRLEALHDSLPT
jgi:hypothetical protein